MIHTTRTDIDLPTLASIIKSQTGKDVELSYRPDRKAGDRIVEAVGHTDVADAELQAALDAYSAPASTPSAPKSLPDQLQELHDTVTQLAADVAALKGA